MWHTQPNTGKHTHKSCHWLKKKKNCTKYSPHTVQSIMLWCYLCYNVVHNTAWCSEIGSLTSLMHVTQVHPVTTENQFTAPGCTAPIVHSKLILMQDEAKAFVHKGENVPKSLECAKTNLEACLFIHLSLSLVKKLPWNKNKKIKKLVEAQKVVKK